MIEDWHIWIVAGIVLWIIEIFTPGFVAGVFGTACLIAAPFAGTGVTFKIQLLIFGISTAILFFGIRPFMLKYLYTRKEKVKTNVDALVSKSGLVTEVIDHASGTGRVKIDGEDWRAVTLDESLVDVGQRVIVREIDGSKVVVEAPTTK